MAEERTVDPNQQDNDIYKHPSDHEPQSIGNSACSSVTGKTSVLGDGSAEVIVLNGDTKHPLSESNWSRNSSTKGKKPQSGSLSDASSEVSLPTPPDGGWGWIVVLASFMVHLIADGCAFSFGVLYTELLVYFGESKGKTAWVGSLFVSVPLMTGPVASALTNRYGCRKTTIVGGIIAAIGFILSSFVDSIELLCFTFGIISGFGLSMVYVPGVVIVAYYFEKRRAFATGIAVAGSGIGTFVFAPLTEHLIELYSWKGAVLIIGGIMFNICACGAVFRPLLDEEDAKKKRYRKRTADKVSCLKGDNSDQNGHVSNAQEEFQRLLAAQRKFETTKPPLVGFEEDLMVHSLVQFPTYLQNDMSTLPPDLLKELAGGNRTLHDIISDNELVEKYYATQSLTDVMHPVEDATYHCANGHMTPSTSTSDHPVGNGHLKSNAERRDLIWQKRCHTPGNHLRSRDLYNRLRPMYRKDIFYRGSLVRTGRSLGSGMRAASCPDIVMKSLEASSEDLDQDGIFPLSCMSFSREVKQIMGEMLDTSILRSVIFVYFSLSSMLLYLWYDVPYVYTPDKAKGMGINDDNASYLVSIIGIVSTVGQIVIGYLGDRPHVNTLHLYNFLTSTAGIATVIVPLIPTYMGLCLYSGTFGFFISGNYALTTIILVELLGMEKLTNAYGLMMLAEGISNLIGPPIAGKRLRILTLSVCSRLNENLDISILVCLSPINNPTKCSDCIIDTHSIQYV